MDVLVMMALGVVGGLVRLWLLNRREKQILRGAVERIPHSWVIDVEGVRHDGSRTHLRIALASEEVEPGVYVVRGGTGNVFV